MENGRCKGEKEYFDGIRAGQIEMELEKKGDNECTCEEVWVEDLIKEKANAAVIISEKNAEIEDLKHRLDLTRRILRHIWREYQEVRGIKAVDVIV